MKKLYDLWQRVPFRHVVALTIALYVIKEQFPFSNFPMYSNFDTEADVLYIADQNGKPMSLDAVFKAGSSTAKKAYKKELGKITNPKGRDSKQSTVEERHAAGEIVLGDWYNNMRRGSLPPNTKSIRLYRRTFQLVNGKLGDETPELLAERPL